MKELSRSANPVSQWSRQGVRTLIGAKGTRFLVCLLQLTCALAAQPPRPPSITNEPQSTATAEGFFAFFQVTPAGDTPFTFRWRKDGVDLTDNGRLSGTRSARLNIVNAQLSDAGEYRVVVSNHVGVTTSQVARLTVVRPSRAQTITFTNPILPAGFYFGFSVAAVGGDKVLVGAPESTNGVYSTSGAALLYDLDGRRLATFYTPGGPGFGYSVAPVGTDKFLVGAAPGGYASLFSTNDEIFTLDGSAGFGSSVAGVGTDKMLIGAPDTDYDFDFFPNAGAAYLFGAGGEPVASFLNPDPGFYTHFGYSVAGMGHDRVLIGSDGVEDGWSFGLGAAFLFSTNGSLLRVFENPTQTSGGRFGRSVAVVGTDKVLIGADDRAYLFATNGMLERTFTNSTSSGVFSLNDLFGWSVAGVGADKVLIGAPINYGGVTNIGAAYLFWTNGMLLRSFTNPIPVVSNAFGYSVSAVGPGKVLIGAPGAGSASLFNLFEVLVNGRANSTNYYVFYETNLITIALINAASPGGEIHYTLDGSLPTLNSAPYTGPFTVSNSVTVRAISYDAFFQFPPILSDAVTITVVPLVQLHAATLGGGTISNSPPGQAYLSNYVVTLTARANTGWQFQEWIGDERGTEPILQVTMNRTKSVEAVFSTGLSTTNIGSPGSVRRDPLQGPYPYGSVVRLSALPDPGNYFNRWGGAAFGNGSVNPLEFRITNANPTVIGVFETNPVSRLSLTTLISGNGTVTRSLVASNYAIGANVTLTSSPAPGYFFAGWSGDASGTANPLGLVMINNKLITANFARGNAPPVVAILSPFSGAVFKEPATNTVRVEAGDDQRVSLLQLYAGTNLLAGATNTNSLSFTWEAVPSGHYTLTARAVDLDAAASTSAPVSITVTSPPPSASVFRFAVATRTVQEGTTNVLVTVTRSGGSGAAYVGYHTGDGNARASEGDYTGVSGTVVFNPGQTTNDIHISIANDAKVEGAESFTVHLDGTSPGDTLGTLTVATVVITDDNDDPTTDSFLTQQAPGPFPTNGFLRVLLTPAAANGQWHFVWEPFWRNSGELVNELSAGEYEIEFRPVDGFAQPDLQVVQMFTGRTNDATFAYSATAEPRRGALSVELAPANVPGLAWRLPGGDPTWRLSGTTVSNLSAGVHLIEFRPVINWATPAVLGSLVVANQKSIYAATYRYDQPISSTAPPPGVAAPLPLDFTEVTDSLGIGGAIGVGLPYGYGGQISTELGLGSGCVVKERVVLTAAHILFDDVNLTFAYDVSWYFQRHRGVHEPRPLLPRGFYVLSGYASRREADRSPGVSSVASWDLDAAAMFFGEAAGRGGYSGFLAGNLERGVEWLTNKWEALLAGYPMEGVPEPRRGVMHSTPVFTNKFKALSNQVYYATDVVSYPGNSGGPLCLRFTNGIYYPTAIYLGGSGESVVRAIDTNVVNLINAAELSAHRGTNSTSGGVIFIGGPLGQQTAPANLRVSIGPAAALAQGGAWRVSAANSGGLQSPYLTFTNYGTASVTLPLTLTRVSVGDTRYFTNDHFRLDVRDLPDWISPSNFGVPIAGASAELNLRYTPWNPRMVIDRTMGIGVQNRTTGTTYRIESTPSLPGQASWISNAHVTLTNGTNPIYFAPVPANGTRFYRAVWSEP